jgi:IgGFc binding protein
VPKTIGRGKSFHLTTNAPVGLTSIYPAAGGASWVTTATLLLPVPLWGKENMIVNAWGAVTNSTGFNGAGPTTQIVASQDDTQVTVYPTHAIQGKDDVAGTAEGVPATYQLNRGEVLQFRQVEELTGSVVVSNNPISIFGGHECALIPSDTMACDYAQQQLPALAQWGSEYAALGYRPRLEKSEGEAIPYRIVAARDGTKLDYDPPLPPPGAPLELAAGEVATFFTGVGQPFVVRTQDAEHPIYMAAYMTGADALDANGVGDAEFVNVVPAQQYQNAYSFYADPTYADTSLAIIRRKTNGEFKDVWLECAGILSDWKAIGVRGEYEWRRIELARRFGKSDSFGDTTCGLGLQRMRSDGQFTATVWGWDSYTSYAYPGGTALRNVSTGSFAPVH